MKGRITVDQAIFVGLVLLAALVRVWNLGSAPLQADEAVVALESWFMSRGLPSTVEFGPVITYGNALVFSLFGANDASARVLPALAGSVLVALCYFSRPYLGRHAAIAGAFLLALSPTSVYFSRFVGSEIVAATALFGSAMLLFRYLGGRRPTYLYGCAASLGVAVGASVTGLVGLTTLLSFWGLTRLVSWAGRGRQLPTLASGPNAMDGGTGKLVLSQDPRVIRKALAIFGAVVLLVATGGLSNLYGFQQGIISRSMPSADVVGYTPAYYVQILIIYETIVVVFAFARVFYSSRQSGLFSWFVAWWAFVSLVLYSVWPQKSPSLAIHILVPMTLLAAEFIGDLLAWFEVERPFARLGTLAAFVTPPLFLAFLTLGSFSLPDERIPWEFALAPLLMLALPIAGFVRWRGATETIRLAGICLLSLLLAVYLHAGSNLNFAREPNATELYAPSVTVGDARNLATDISELARLLGGTADKSVFVDSWFQYPLAWYLRNVDGIEYGARPTGDPRIVVAREGRREASRAAEAVQPDARYLARYVVSASWEPRELDPAMLWRWLAYREPDGSLRYNVAEVTVKR